VPILSPRTLTVKLRYFRLEWGWAERVADQLPANRRFIVPLVAGEVAPNDPALPTRFCRIHWERLAPDAPNTAIVALLRQYFRDYRKSLAEGS